MMHEQRTVQSEMLAPLLRPRSIVVVGASPRRRMARTVLSNLRTFGFRGPVWALHPSGEPVEGFPCFRTVEDLPETPDCAVIALSPENTLQAFRALAERGVRAAVLLGSGFAEAGPSGLAIQQEITAIARDRGIAVCGPNCLGLVTPDARATLTGYHLPGDLATGPAAAVVQSGSVFWSLAHNTRSLRFRYLVSSGNEAVLTAADYFAAALSDPHVRLLVGFLEVVRDGERFLDVIQAAHARSVPIVLLKVGRSELARATVLAHTGAIAGSDAIFRDIMRQYGVILVETLDELYDTAEFLLAGRWPRSFRVGVVTDSGGEKALIADWGERIGLEFPPLSPKTAERLRTVLAPYVKLENPLDAWGSGNFDEVYPATLAAFAEDPNIETIVLGTDMVRETEEAHLYAETMLALRERTAKPLAVVTNQATGLACTEVQRLRAAGVPVLQGTEYGYRAIAHAARYSQWRASAPDSLASPSSLGEIRQEIERWHQRATRSAPDQPVTLTEYEAKQILARIGLPIPSERWVTCLEEALAAADEIGFPVVLKAQGPNLLHKSDLGAVRLGISDRQALIEAWQGMVETLAATPSLEVTGYLVQRQIPHGLELLLGCLRDSTFGMVVSVGLGGEFVEIWRDVIYRKAPVSPEEADRMLSELRGAALLAGHRRLAPRDRRAAAEAIARFSWFAVAAADLIEVAEVNPLIVLEEGRGAWAVDSLIVLRAPERRNR
jgi:acyl-CoA synthetase (NDP forming)